MPKYTVPGAWCARGDGADIAGRRSGPHSTAEREAATAIGFGGTPPPRQMRLVDWRPLIKGALKGFVSVELPVGLQILDCPVLTSGGKSWVSLPAKPQLDRDGHPIVKNGKAQFSAILKWRDRALSDRWSDAVVALIRAAHPDALDDGGEP
ncbi:MAG: hypothetical protein ACREJM_13065 [Candidatus Saccharimonadales bacterium]